MTILEKIYSKCKVNPETGCLEWQGGKTPDGYGKIKIKQKTKRVHRVVYEELHGPIPPGLFVCHHCDNVVCVRYKCLFLGTHKENMDDMYNKKRGPTGSKNGTNTKPESRVRGTKSGMSKLNDDAVRTIRLFCKKNDGSFGMIAKRLGVSTTTVIMAYKRKTWSHVV